MSTWTVDMNRKAAQKANTQNGPVQMTWALRHVGGYDSAGTCVMGVPPYCMQVSRAHADAPDQNLPVRTPSV
ncbi:MAG: hypothetical protein GFH27_549293n246 [Chloroflexi bacterium AL-W]|nr:hypothetical protein [Chloroflexi bacterium AL-N1]NOK67639.1 hypothetical protein [Chloroflexi bacterium AL-N10]NOK75591.1 hypothetical protein [Chloroflexi bacterium AL-N5]NOK82379.1 hypothetical protein [Chloroflexi bacterium AL-W]NOK90224.1 hypothetical protein [Chloroflexi bacterium AL-N15]